MHRIAFSLLLLFIFQHSWASVRVIIDPGHGGIDNGAVKNYAREANITLSVSKYLNDLLKEDPDFDPFLTRKSDKTLGLKERSVFARENEAKIFVSIHANSSPSVKATGVEIYFQNILQPDQYSMFLANRENEGEESMRGQRPSMFKGKTYPDEVANILDDMARTHFINQSYDLAKKIKQRWEIEMSTKRQKIRQAPFYVVSSVNMPSVLIEIGYLTNPIEAKRLNSEHYQRRIADTIYKGLKDFKEVMDK